MRAIHSQKIERFWNLADKRGGQEQKSPVESTRDWNEFSRVSFRYFVVWEEKSSDLPDSSGGDDLLVDVQELYQVHAGNQIADRVFLVGGCFELFHRPPDHIVDPDRLNAFRIGQPDKIGRRIGVNGNPLGGRFRFVGVRPPGTVESRLGLPRISDEKRKKNE